MASFLSEGRANEDCHPGGAGSFSHEAALKLAPDATIVPTSHSADVFAALAEGAVDAAAIPIENSLAGSVAEHFDLLLEHDVQVERETCCGSGTI